MVRRISEARWKQFQHTIAPETPDPLETQNDTKMLEAWKETVPQNRFGEVSLTAAAPGFRKQFDEALQSGFAAEFIDALMQGFAHPYQNIYTVRARRSDLSESDQNIFDQHQPFFLLNRMDALELFKEKVYTSPLPPLFQNLYLEKAASTQRFVQAALSVGTPEFTRLQQSPEAWEQLINRESTAQTGEVTLHFEKAALAVLEKNSEMKPHHLSINSVLDDIWHLSEAEKTTLGFDSNDPVIEKLTAEQGMKLFGILLHRIGLDDWQVEKSSGSAINVTAPAKKISYPISRELDADDIAFVFPHEFVHIIRGANGAQQNCSLLESGMEDYLTTEEGLATLSEMIVGQPFGHRRQVLFAARYWAVAQALKTEVDPVTQVRKAQYSLQDIYQQLIDFHLSEKDATEITWRIFRGTSLHRQTVDLGIKDANNVPIVVAETFAKDAVYFVGQMMMFEHMKNILPLLEDESAQKPFVDAQDFSDRVLSRVGRAIALHHSDENDINNGYLTRRESYQALVDLGRTALIALLQYFIPGKMTLESLTDPESEWQTSLKREGLIQYEQLFRPANLNTR